MSKPQFAFDRRPLPRVERFALDRASDRTIDADGRMHVVDCPISKATVNPYYGWEIPNYEELKLDPNKIYRLLRDPKELEKAAASFNNIQILDDHDPVNADNPKKEIVAGTTGTDTYFDGDYLRSTVTIWDQGAINEIDAKKKRELSSSYRYKPVMEAGTYRGLPYDGRMVNIKANHVALVKKGRAGPDVMVSDAQPEGLEKMNRAQRRALASKIKAKFANDADVDLGEIVQLLEAANEGEGAGADDDDMNQDPNMAAGGMSEDQAAWLKDKLGEDGFEEFNGMGKPKAEDEAGDDDDDDDGMTAEEKAAKAKKEKDDMASDTARNRPRVAMDADAIRKAALADFANVQRAVAAVTPHIGPVTMALDSVDPARLYRLALDAHKVPHKSVSEVSALEAMVGMLPLKSGSSPFAADAAPAAGEIDPVAAALTSPVKTIRS